MKPVLREQVQNYLITSAFVAPLLASPFYLMAYLGWATSDAHSPVPLTKLLMYWIIPSISLSMLLFVLSFGRMTPRKLLAVFLAATPSLIELSLVLKWWRSG